MEVFRWLEAHESLSGWAQAVGSILTLWIGVYIAGSRQKVVAKAHALNARYLGSDAISACYEIFDDVRVNFPSSDGSVENQLSTMAAKQDAMLHFPTHELPPRAIESFDKFRKSVTYFGRVATTALSGASLPVSATNKVLVIHHYIDAYENWLMLVKMLGVKRTRTSLEKKRSKQLAAAYEKAQAKEFQEMLADLKKSLKEQPSREGVANPI